MADRHKLFLKEFNLFISVFSFKFLAVLFFLSITYFNYSSDLRVGISRLYKGNNDLKEPEYHKLEDYMYGVVSDKLNLTSSYCSVYSSLNSIKKYFNSIKTETDLTNDSDFNLSGIIPEIKDNKYFIALEINQFTVSINPNFYDSNIKECTVTASILIAIFDTSTLDLIDQQRIEVNYSTREQRNSAVDFTILNLIKKFRTYIEENSLLEKQINIIKDGPIFVRVSGGEDMNLMPLDLIKAYSFNNSKYDENTLLRVLLVKPTYSICSIVYSKNKREERGKLNFNKDPHINLDLQIYGGFAITSTNNSVSGKTDGYPAFIPVAGLKLLIPVKLPFFRPLAQVEFNFILTDSNQFLLPISIETGAQGEFYLKRLEIFAGLLIGVLFSQDEDLNYETDSFSLRPYINLSFIPVKNVRLFMDFGYRFFLENVLYNDWGIDLKGVFFNFGITVNF